MIDSLYLPVVSSCSTIQGEWMRRGYSFRGRILTAVVIFVAVFGGLKVPAVAAELERFLNDVALENIVPGADRLGGIEGSPPAAPAYRGSELVGYVFLNSDAVNAVGYSGKPIHIVIGMAPDGTITGAKLVEHHEPIVLIGIPEKRITNFIDAYKGRNVVEEATAPTESHAKEIDIVSGATVTVLVIDDLIRRSAIKIARSRGLGHMAATRAETQGAKLDLRAEPELQDWKTLLGNGSVRRLALTVGDVTKAFRSAGDDKAADRPEMADPQATFIDLYVALVSIPSVGLSLLGEREYENLERWLTPRQGRASTEQATERATEPQNAILVAGEGAYSFKGLSYVRGGIFDRIQLVQGDTAIRFRDRNHRRIADIAADGAPRFSEIGLFRIPPEVEFDPARPWRLELLVQRAVGAREKAFTSFDLAYSPPEQYLIRPPAEASSSAPTATGAVGVPAAGANVAGPGLAGFEEPAERDALWRRVWESKTIAIAMLLAALGLLTLLFFFQDWLVRRRKLAAGIRYGFLILILAWLGWYANAQLSVVNVLTFSNALVSDFSWTYFLMDPLVFILWSSVAAGLLFWGRGSFCGWLCPFGALQELSNHLGRRLGIKQFALPWGLNERLWPIKYMIFLGLFGLSLYSLAMAERLAEVEPFKTAIILDFVRTWPFVAYAVALLVVGLFIERFFCRYICPLGAALAIPARIRMFDWLKRWPECGSPCQRCANICPTAAIHPDGRINVNECIYCLECLKLYYDDQRCPHMIQQRLKRERRLLISSDKMLSEKEREQKKRLQAASVQKKSAQASPGTPQPT